ncbi:MAG: transposase [bacterium]|nr:transposase [bacterium]
MFDSWRFLKKHRQIDLLAFVVMENHLHWIAVGPDLSERVGQFKSFTARQILQALEERGFRTLLSQLKYFKRPEKRDQVYQLWQEGSHPQRVENEAMLRQKIQYIHDNPLRRGYVDDPIAWRYSSARIYAGQPGMLELMTDW